VTLAVGTRLGTYEILGVLGAGGMGEVYRARDTKLDREVAVKVLPPRLADDPDALGRLEREAKAVAALSHPNILAIHDFGHEGRIAYAVMELLDGQTLRARLATGGLPARKAVEHAVQIAHGLAAAHEKGIVHRDLKPENVFVLRDGRVKVLDFGLARQLVPAGGPDDSVSPTLAHHTDPGTVLGTVAYMSPEQVRGSAVDQRSDIFAFGCVLYELLAGVQAFRRETAAETMTAILKEDPTDAPELDQKLSPALERILRHCLEKDPEQRFQSARDLAFDLESVSGTSARSVAVAAVPHQSAWRLSPPLAIVAALTLLALGFGLGRWGRPGPSPAQAPLGTDFIQLTYQSDVLSYPSVSPDGSSFVYAGRGAGNLDVYFQRAGGTNSINLTADCERDDTEPALSPDGTTVAFRSEREGGGIFLMGATGESVRRLTDTGYNPAWSPNGKEIVYATEGARPFFPYGRSGFAELWAVALGSGEKRRITSSDAADAAQPSWSPHGHRIAYWGLRIGGQRDLWTVSSDGSQASSVAVTEDPALDWNPVWSPDGQHLYFASDRGGTMGLWRVAIDEPSGQPLGVPEPITLPSAFACYFSVTRDGKQVLFASLTQTSVFEKLGFDPASRRILGAPTHVFESSLGIFYFDVSPDGEWIALSSSGSREDLFVLKTDGTGLRQLTNDTFKDRGPFWSADGRRILFYSNRSGRYEAWTVRPDGSGLTQLTQTSGSDKTNPAWSPDGSLLVSSDGANGSYLYRLGGPLGQASAEPLPRPGDNEVFVYPTWSRDGRRLAGQIDRPVGVPTLAVYSLDSRTYQKFDVEGGGPIWTDDDRSLLFQRSGSLQVLDLRSGQAHELVVPGGAGRVSSAGISGFALPRDQRTLFLQRSRSHADIWQMTLQAEGRE